MDIPHAARSALDILRTKRLQKHSSRPTLASSPTAASPPLHDTLPNSEAPRDPSQPRGVSAPIEKAPQPAELDMPPMDSTLPNITLEHSDGVLESEPDMPPLDDTALDAVAATNIHSAEHAPQIGKQTGGKTLPAPLYDTLDPGMTLGPRDGEQEEVGDDEMLIRQAVNDESAGAVHSSPTPGQDDDEALLQSLLEEEEMAQLRC